jgi:hypothetical protein
MADSREIDIAWAAGLFDGEGCVWLKRIWRKGKPLRGRFVLRPKVRMTHRDTINQLAKVFPGGERPSPDKAKKQSCKDAYEIRWNGKAGEHFLRTIRPYLVTKAKEVDIVLKRYLKAPKGADGDEEREACYQDILKARGKLEDGTTAASTTIADDLAASNDSLQPINRKVRVCTTRSLFDQDGA